MRGLLTVLELVKGYRKLLRFETKRLLAKRSPRTLSNLCLSARTEPALHMWFILSVYTACNVPDSTSDETYTNV